MARYSILVMEPSISSEYRNTNILWKAQIDAPENYISINHSIVKDNIEIDNRKKIENWFKILDDSNIKYFNNFDSDYCKEIIVFDDNDCKFKIQLFACDIKAANYLIEVEQDYILPVLFLLDLKKYGEIFPTALMNKLTNAKQILVANNDQNYANSHIVLKYFKQIEKLIDHCQNYEHNIKYYIFDR